MGLPDVTRQRTDARWSAGGSPFVERIHLRRGNMKKHCICRFFSLSCSAPALLHARAEGHFDRTLQVSGIVSLDVTTGSGDITIKAGGSNQVVVHGTVDSSNNNWFSNAEARYTRSNRIPRFSRTGTAFASVTTCPKM